MKIDVCIPTLNSEKTLRTSLESIIRYVPYKRIIIMDGYSKDDTVKIAKEYGCEIFYSKSNLGGARNELIKKVETKWFAFIDSDVVIHPKWFEILRLFMDRRVGAIQGFAVTPNLIGELRKYHLFLKTKLKLEQRGFLSNTLLRKDVVKDIVLPDVKRGEDIIFQDEIRNKGWKWIFVPIFSIHLKSTSQIIREAAGDLLRIHTMGYSFINTLRRM